VGNLTLEEYLDNEEIINLSNLPFSEIKSGFNNEFNEVLENLYSCTQEAIVAFYSYIINNGYENLFDGSTYDRTIKTIPLVKSEIEGQNSILEIGCGSGLKSVYYALKFPETNFLCLDLNEISLNVARKRSDKYGCKNIEFIKGDLLDLNIDKTFSCVLAEYSLHETSNNNYNPFNEKITKIRELIGRPDNKFVGILTPSEIYSFCQSFWSDAHYAGIDVDFKQIDFIQWGHEHSSLLITGKPINK
jgi:SAM-dependent methyltransferase